MAGIGYCIRCRKKVEIAEGKLVYYKNGVPVEKGRCVECGAGVARILSKPEREELKKKALKGDEE